MVEPGYVWGTSGVTAEVDSQIRSQELLAARVNLGLMRLGVSRLIAPMLMGKHDLPGASGVAYDALTLTTRQHETFEQEIVAGEVTANAVLRSRKHLRDVPLVVLSAESHSYDPVAAAVLKTHYDLAALSAQGRHIGVPEH